MDLSELTSNSGPILPGLSSTFAPGNGSEDASRGDAAAPFLPTAGVGASNALRAVVALREELSRADGALVLTALDLYVKRCMKIVWGNQDDSRLAARSMFVESRLMGWAETRSSNTIQHKEC
jgi:2-polyprenyl-6-methoxyphenol hydroxylase-like FAD-dependent oxidoreductase